MLRGVFCAFGSRYRMISLGKRPLGRLRMPSRPMTTKCWSGSRCHVPGGCPYAKVNGGKSQDAKQRFGDHLFLFNVIWHAATRLICSARKLGAVIALKWQTYCECCKREEVKYQMEVMKYRFLQLHSCMYGLRSTARSTKGRPAGVLGRSMMSRAGVRGDAYVRVRAGRHATEANQHGQYRHAWLVGAFAPGLFALRRLPRVSPHNSARVPVGIASVATKRAPGGARVVNNSTTTAVQHLFKFALRGYCLYVACKRRWNSDPRRGTRLGCAPIGPMQHDPMGAIAAC